jgi:hypothetical protein
MKKVFQGGCTMKRALLCKGLLILALLAGCATYDYGPGPGSGYPPGPGQGPGYPPAPPPAWQGTLVIGNMEASPVRFTPGQPIQFVMIINNTGPVLAEADVGVFHEGRLVGWERNKVLNPGSNVFRIQDAAFPGGPGNYIVSVRHRGHTIAERRFMTRTTVDGKYTIDPR